ncbi:hypothetical protein Fmac_016143 [Flemingia macrophylla]|uniref:Uncharacterized protein n=1 Tax=Flemingia macrophylla TaxID=520843 RepID=A0ABD1MGK8_9FABA
MVKEFDAKNLLKKLSNEAFSEQMFILENDLRYVYQCLRKKICGSTTANTTNPLLRELGGRILPWPRLPLSRFLLPRPVWTESAAPTPIRGSSFALAMGAWKPWERLKAWHERLR